jgi:AcrR family transcriptional regulator
MKKTRVLLSKADWVEAAIHELSVNGFECLAVEPLARRLDISKGSFYWHFKDLKELVAVVLETWQARAFTDVIAQLGSIRDPRQRLAALIHTAWSGHHYLRAEGALVSAAVAGNKQVVPVVRAVIDGRVGYLRDLYLAMGLSPADAGQWALTAYSAYAGLVQLVAVSAKSLTSEKEVRALAAHIERVLIPAQAVKSRGRSSSAATK